MKRYYLWENSLLDGSPRCKGGPYDSREELLDRMTWYIDESKRLGWPTWIMEAAVLEYLVPEKAPEAWETPLESTETNETEESNG